MKIEQILLLSFFWRVKGCVLIGDLRERIGYRAGKQILGRIFTLFHVLVHVLQYISLIRSYPIQLSLPLTQICMLINICESCAQEFRVLSKYYELKIFFSKHSLHFQNIIALMNNVILLKPNPF